MGEFGLVNPRYPEIDGVAASDSIEKLAFTPELVVITAPARSIAGLIGRIRRRLGFDADECFIPAPARVRFRSGRQLSPRQESRLRS